jgi:Farnesoic acid 0-methyl transferase
MDYAFHEASPTSAKCTLRFKVKAAHDAHVCLSSSDEQDATPIIEIFLGGWDNSKCAIRRDRAKPDRVSTITDYLVELFVMKTIINKFGR